MTCTLWYGLEEYCSIIISYLHCRSSVIFPSWKKWVRKLDVNVVPILYSCIAVFSEMKRYMNKIEKLYILMKRFWQLIILYHWVELKGNIHLWLRERRQFWKKNFKEFLCHTKDLGKSFDEPSMQQSLLFFCCCCFLCG